MANHTLNAQNAVNAEIIDEISAKKEGLGIFTVKVKNARTSDVELMIMVSTDTTEGGTITSGSAYHTIKAGEEDEIFVLKPIDAKSFAESLSDSKNTLGPTVKVELLVPGEKDRVIHSLNAQFEKDTSIVHVPDFSYILQSEELTAQQKRAQQRSQVREQLNKDT